jgi:hypothetical protein
MRGGKFRYYFFIVFISLISLPVVTIAGQSKDTITEERNDAEDGGLFTQIIAKHREVYNDHSYQAVFELRDLLLRFFQTDESLSFDFHKYSHELSWSIYYISSDDGLISVFSWDTADGYSRSTFDSLLQYKTANGELKTISIPQMLANITKYPEPDSLLYDYEYHDYSFDKIVTLKENVYLLDGGNRDSIAMAVELKDNEIIPCDIFNKKMFFWFRWVMKGDFYFYAGYYPGVIDITINGEKQPFSITLTLLYPKDPKNNHNSDAGWLQADDFYKRVETFVFNGTEFVGDYSIFLDF